MSHIIFRLHNLENASDSISDVVDALQHRYCRQVEDDDGNYRTTVDRHSEISEDWLHNQYSPDVENPDHYNLSEDFRSYISNRDYHSRLKWHIDGLLINFWDMEVYDLGSGGLAPPGGAANSDGATFWASGDRGVVHEGTHTMMDSDHWHHNMGRKDKDSGNATAMGATNGEGCSYMQCMAQPDLENGTTKLGYRTVDAIRAFRDTESAYYGMDDECYD